VSGWVWALLASAAVLAVLLASRLDVTGPPCIQVACRATKSSPGAPHRPTPFIQIVPERTTT
jgi:hypothetical protein